MEGWIASSTSALSRHLVHEISIFIHGQRGNQEGSQEGKPKGRPKGRPEGRAEGRPEGRPKGVAQSS